MGGCRNPQGSFTEKPLFPSYDVDDRIIVREKDWPSPVVEASAAHNETSHQNGLVGKLETVPAQPFNTVNANTARAASTLATET
jgi:hypothetical protein